MNISKRIAIKGMYLRKKVRNLPRDDGQVISDDPANTTSSSELHLIFKNIHYYFYIQNGMLYERDYKTTWIY